MTYENLVEGTYRFLLQVWTNSNELSQDTVYVYVHSTFSLYNNIDTANTRESEKSSDLNLIYDNLIQIELDYNPSEFSQNIKDDFLRRLEILLQQSKSNFNNLKVILTNTRVSTFSKTSRVVVEFFACEDLPVDTNTNKDPNNVFDFKQYANLEQVRAKLYN